MSQQWAIPVRVCVHGADSICIGTHQIVSGSVTVYTGHIWLTLHMHSVWFSICQSNLGKKLSCWKHITKICSPSFLKWSNFQSEIGFHCIRLDNRPFPSCSSGWQISDTWKWYSMLCYCTNIVSGAPIISHFSYRDSSPVWTFPEWCRADICSKYQNIHTGFSEALDLPLLSLEICDKPSLWEH